MLTMECQACGGRFTAKRATAKFCSGRCRQRAHVAPEGAPPRREGAPLVALAPAAAETGSIVAVTERDLEKLDRLDTPAGQVALLFARILDSGVQDTASNIATLGRTYLDTMARATDGAEAVESPLERLRRARSSRTG